MQPNPQQEREQAHGYLDRLPEAQVSAVRGLLESMLDPVSRALANAPVDDEPVTEAEERAVSEAREWLKHNQGIPFEQVVAELGFTMEEINNYQDPSSSLKPLSASPPPASETCKLSAAFSRSSSVSA